MKLTLMNGYPSPYPVALSIDDAYSFAEAAGGITLTIEGVRHFEWKHTVTIEFSNFEAYERAQQLSGCWMPWSYLVLEAVVSAEDGYEHPAIVFGNKAFCGFRLLD